MCIQVTCNQKVIKIVAIDETLKLTQSNQEIIMRCNRSIIVREINTNTESRHTTPITQQYRTEAIGRSVKARDVRKKGSSVQDGAATKRSAKVKFRTIHSTHTSCKKVTMNIKKIQLLM